MVGRRTVFNAIVADETTELYIFEGLQDSAAAGALLLEVLGGTSADFTLDIQGKVHEAGTYTNIDYIQLYQAGKAALANSQLTVNDQTVRFYLIPIPAPLMQLVATFTAGSLTIHASYIHLSFPLPNTVLAAGASETKTVLIQSATDSSTRATLLTPTSGKKVRVLGVMLNFASTTVSLCEVYFGTGANLATTAGKEIAYAVLEVINHPMAIKDFPDGAGPIGATDEVVSIRTDTDQTTSMRGILYYREED